MRKRIINNHMMKVFVTKDDLKVNGITALDLLGDHNQIEKFFYKILDKVDSQHLFSEHEPLTFRVLPNKRGLSIIISSHTDHKPLVSKTQTHKSLSNDSLTNDVVKLKNFESFIRITRILKIIDGDSALYKYNGIYYLDLMFSGNLSQLRVNDIKNKLSVVYEYGDPTHISPDILKKHGKVIMASHALETGRKFFN